MNTKASETKKQELMAKVAQKMTNKSALCVPCLAA
uniref:Uncharacterized protein n=1 Tax=Cyanothece sp. (strain PCC 7425 / ATCC 29141) TaxID=395961 RepID=B8HWZ5_CYAP4